MFPPWSTAPLAEDLDAPIMKAFQIPAFLTPWYFLGGGGGGDGHSTYLLRVEEKAEINTTAVWVTYRVSGTGKVRWKKIYAYSYS